MRLLENITGKSMTPSIKPVAPSGDLAPRGNLDDALMEADAAAKIKALAQSEPKLPPPPISFAPSRRPESKFSISITPSARGLRIDTEHTLETTVTELSGKITFTCNW